MANIPPKVQPGDLITSNYMNAVIDFLSDLDSRIGGTGTGGPPTLPPGTPDGQLLVSMSSSPGGTINADSVVVFVFNVQAAVTLQETYNLSPLLTADALPAQWQAETLDGGNNPISAITIPAAPPPTGTTRQVRVRVTIPPGTDGTQASLSLSVASQRNPTLADTSSPTVIDVGSSAPVPEALTISAPEDPPINGSLDPDGTLAASLPQTRATYSVSGVTSGTDYTVNLGTIPSGWAAAVLGGNQQTATSTLLTIRVDFTPGSGAAAATFSLRVSETGDPTVFGTRPQAVRPA